MLIVAMLAQTTTAVPAQRLLFPQHWLLVGWDIVSRCWLPVCSRWVGGAARALRLTKGLPSRSSTIDRESAGTLHHRGDRSTRQKLATPQTS